MVRCLLLNKVHFSLAQIHDIPFNNPTMLINLSVQQLRQAANLKEQIESLNKELGAILGSAGVSAPSKASKPVKKGGMSAAGKARIVAAQKLRWAKVKAAKPIAKAAVKPAKKKRTISAAGIARIKAAQKARWAKIKAVKPAPVAKPVVKAAVKTAKKFTMSAGARAAISAAAKLRWAKIKAAKKQ